MKPVLRMTLEKMALGCFFFAIFLPARLIIFNYITTHWLGSTVFISTILAIIYLLSVKGKLPFFGPILLDILYRLRRSKIRHFSMIIVILGLILNGSMLYGLNFASENMSLVHDNILNELDSQEISDLNDLNESSQTAPQPTTWLFSGITSFFNLHEYSQTVPQPTAQDYQTFLIMFLTDPDITFPLAAIMLNVIDELTNFWLSHLLIVSFIEFTESFATLLYFGYLRRTNPQKEAEGAFRNVFA